MSTLAWTLATLGGLVLGAFLYAALSYRERIEDDPIERQFKERS